MIEEHLIEDEIFEEESEQVWLVAVDNKRATESDSFKMGSVDIVLPSRDSARIARTFILTVQR